MFYRSHRPLEQTCVMTGPFNTRAEAIASSDEEDGYVWILERVKVENKVNPLKEIWNTWPGDESIEEILEALAELDGKKGCGHK